MKGKIEVGNDKPWVSAPTTMENDLARILFNRAVKFSKLEDKLDVGKREEAFKFFVGLIEHRVAGKRVMLSYYIDHGNIEEALDVLVRVTEPRGEGYCHSHWCIAEYGWCSYCNTRPLSYWRLCERHMVVVYFRLNSNIWHFLDVPHYRTRHIVLDFDVENELKWRVTMYGYLTNRRIAVTCTPQLCRFLYTRNSGRAVVFTYRNYGSPASYHTVLSSLNRLISGIRELYFHFSRKPQK